MSSSQLIQLRNAVKDARLLVDFAVTSNRHVEDKIIDDILKKTKELGDLDAQQSIDLEKEAEFWKAYQALTQATIPVSASSIAQSEAEARKWYGATAKHAAVTVILFLVWALLQATWVIGTTLRKDLDDADKAISVNEDKRRPIDFQLRILESEHDRLEESLKDVAIRKRLQEIGDLQTKLTEQIFPIDQELTTLRNQREPLVELLNGWYSTTTFRPSLKIDAKILDLQRQVDDIKKHEILKKSGSFLSNFQITQLTRQIGQARDQRVFELKHRADLLLDVLQKYTFPVLLGLLGALTYILRSMIVQLREYSYRSNFSSLTFVRICLGMMSGLLGGMLISPNDTVLKNLPPLALPFLFGYAIEVIFSFLDRIVKAFIDEKPPTQ